MEGFEKLQDVASRRKAEEPARKARHQEDSKLRLQKNVQTKIKTSFIGAIAQFEMTFGHLWGHGQKEALTERQQDWLDAWNECRDAILTKGNNQVRGIESELKQYIVEWVRYKTFLKTKEA